MDAKTSAIRYVLSSTDPKTAERMVLSFSLPEEEERCIILKEIHHKSIQQIAFALCISPETVKRRRRSGLLKMVDAISL